MWKEFKTFIMRGNVLDLAVGVVIGGAFTAIVNSLVKDSTFAAQNRQVHLNIIGQTRKPLL